MRPGLYYFAHPYSAATQQERTANFELCCKRTARLLLAGYNVFSPIVHSHPIEIWSDELQQMSTDELWHFWIEIDKHIIEHVDFEGLILAPLWTFSQGCRIEHEIFFENGKPILFYEDIVKDKP